MSLKSLSEFAFDELVRARGDEYFRTGRVSVTDRKTARVRYAVRGTETYGVELEQKLEERELKMSCACGHFMKVNFCKHIWASLRLADRDAHFPELSQKPELRFSFGGALEGIEDADANGVEESLDERIETPPNEADYADVLAESRAQDAPRPRPGWRDALANLNEDAPVAGAPAFPRYQTRPRQPRTAYFAIDLPKSKSDGRISLRFLTRELLKSGKPGVLKGIELHQQDIALFKDPNDQAVLWELLGKGEPASAYSYSSHRGHSGAVLRGPHAPEILEKIQATNRLCLIERRTGGYFTPRDRVDARPYTYNNDPWQLELELRPDGPNYLLAGVLKNGTLEIPTEQITAHLAGFVFMRDELAPLEPSTAGTWVDLLARTTPVKVAAADLEEFLSGFYERERQVPLNLPSSLSFTDVEGIEPRPRFVVQRAPRTGRLMARVEFSYEGAVTVRHRVGTTIVDPATRRRVVRQPDLEAARLQDLTALEPLFGPRANRDRDHFEFAEGSLLSIAEVLLGHGWEMLAFERRLQASTHFEFEMKTSGIDWFDLKAELHFEKARADLPSLLENLRDGKRFVELDDGSLGMIPAEWLKQSGHLANVGKAQGEALRLNRVQALFLGASLDQHPNFKADEAFADLRSMLKEAPTLPENAFASFRGELRPYQKEGVAWLTSLDRYGFGGILADDMGLGKTIQILAHLSNLPRQKQAAHRPHLIVAPKSLIFNWRREIERFTPQFKTLTYTGKDRFTLTDKIATHDIILTTYANLRSDIEVLRPTNFHYFVLDEAHYIKNPKSQACLASRLIQAERVLCLTGTPVENSLNDVFALLSVANPGLVSPVRAQSLARGADSQATETLGRALRPFILRRTKTQVLTDLPEKMEQIIYCELSKPERKKYDELKTFYWSRLNAKFSEKGFKRSKMDVLEALLRLRQAACHQGLLPMGKSVTHSTKLDLLLEQIESVIQDGHKALIFSQFTSFLAKLIPSLQERSIEFEYLDGKTKDREARVDRFQTDPSKKLFLLSLKAGGVGLNLTAADYVFILDPWWNPAVEAQAIDRAHRIGQSRQVFAYKLIAKDTVEEKILELQKSKRELADALISSDGGPLKALGIEDLQALFS